MKKSILKTEAERNIKDFFENIISKSQNDVKKIKRLAMSYKIKLGGKKKLFCKKCLTPYKQSQTRIKSDVKSVICKKCGFTSRWKIKPS